jgi:hypothetical protein
MIGLQKALFGLCFVCLAVGNMAAADEPGDPAFRSEKTRAADQPVESLECSSSQLVVSDVVIVVDLTSSMSELCVSPAGKERRLAIAAWTLYDILDSIPAGFPTTIISLQNSASKLLPPSELSASIKADLRRNVVQQSSRGTATLGAGLDVVEAYFHDKPHANPVVVLITDGQDCDPYRAQENVKRLYDAYHGRLEFAVIGISSFKEKDAKLEALASVGHGNYSAIDSSKELTAALSRLRQQFEAVRERGLADFKCCRDELTASRAHSRGLQHDLDLARRESQDVEKKLTISQEQLVVRDGELQRSKEELKIRDGEIKQSQEKIVALETRLEEHSKQYLKLEENLTKMIGASSVEIGELKKTASGIATTLKNIDEFVVIIRKNIPDNVWNHLASAGGGGLLAIALASILGWPGVKSKLRQIAEDGNERGDLLGNMKVQLAEKSEQISKIEKAIAEKVESVHQKLVALDGKVVTVDGEIRRSAESVNKTVAGTADSLEKKLEHVKENVSLQIGAVTTNVRDGVTAIVSPLTLSVSSRFDVIEEKLQHSDHTLSQAIETKHVAVIQRLSESERHLGTVIGSAHGDVRQSIAEVRQQVTDAVVVPMTTRLGAMEASLDKTTRDAERRLGNQSNELAAAVAEGIAGLMQTMGTHSEQLRQSFIHGREALDRTVVASVGTVTEGISALGESFLRVENTIHAEAEAGRRAVSDVGESLERRADRVQEVVGLEIKSVEKSILTPLADYVAGLRGCIEDKTHRVEVGLDGKVRALTADLMDRNQAAIDKLLPAVDRSVRTAIDKGAKSLNKELKEIKTNLEEIPNETAVRVAHLEGREITTKPAA